LEIDEVGFYRVNILLLPISGVSALGCHSYHHAISVKAPKTTPHSNPNNSWPHTFCSPLDPSRMDVAVSMVALHCQYEVKKKKNI